MGLDRRQYLPGRTLARTIVFPAPGRRMGAIPLAHQEPLHVRIGHASRRRHHGRTRASGGARNSERWGRLMSAENRVAEMRDVIIVGGGHNGLVAAFYLAKAGFKPLVLDRRAQVGGAAITEELHPGFRGSTLAHNTGPLRADIVRDMQLEQHGLKLTTPDVSTASLLPDGRALVLYSDAKKAAQEIAQWSQRDAASYVDFGTALGKIGKVIGEPLVQTPPNIDSPNSGDLWGMLKTDPPTRNLG